VSLAAWLWLELAKAGRSRPRAGRASHPALGTAHLAAPKKNAERLKATLVFVEESGFSLLPTACRRWSPRGQTPILRHCFNWPQLSAISAVTPNPHVYLHVVAGTIASGEVIGFVRHLRRWIRGPVFLFWDGCNPHRSRRTRAALAEHRGRLPVYRLPAYAPALNPDEGRWAWLKPHALRGLCPPDLTVLRASIRGAMRRLRRRPAVIRSFFQACPLSF
jgi:transposase